MPPKWVEELRDCITVGTGSVTKRTDLDDIRYLQLLVCDIRIELHRLR